MPRVVLSIHDVAPSTAEASRRWLEVAESFGMRASLLVVPGPWQGMDLTSSPGFSQWLHDARTRGHEIVQHGWCHSRVKGRVGIGTRLAGDLLGRGCQEFWELSRDDAVVHLTLGREALRTAGHVVIGFVAPAWLMSRGTRQALADLGYEWTTTHTHVVRVADGARLGSFAVSQRPGSRLSTIAARMTRLAVRASVTMRRTVRIAVHPADLTEHATRDAVVDSLALVMGAGYESVTYGEIVARFGPANADLGRERTVA